MSNVVENQYSKKTYCYFKVESKGIESLGDMLVEWCSENGIVITGDTTYLDGSNGFTSIESWLTEVEQQKLLVFLSTFEGATISK